jgi:2-formylbenzoate dehydrogenase
MTVTARSPGSLGDNEARVADLMRQGARFLIDGELVGAASGRTFPVGSPYSEEVVALVPDGSAADRAVRRAARVPGVGGRLPRPLVPSTCLPSPPPSRSARRTWRCSTWWTGGAPTSIMAADVRLPVEYLRYLAGLALEIKGTSVLASTNVPFTERQPYVVVTRIIPFNRPLMLAASKIAAPLVAGNTVVLGSTRHGASPTRRTSGRFCPSSGSTTRTRRSSWPTASGSA